MDSHQRRIFAREVRRLGLVPRERKQVPAGIVGKTWSWPVVGGIDLFVLGAGIAFMTSSHPLVADSFFVFGTALFVIKFLTWEDTKKHKLVTASVILLSTAILTGTCIWNHSINRLDIASRIDVTNIAGVPLRNAKNQSGFALSVFYSDRGGVPVSSMSHRSVTLTSAVALTQEQEKEHQRVALEVSPPDLDSKNEIQATDTPKHFFSVPDNDEMMDSMAAGAANVLANRERMYLFIAFKYRDKNLPDGKIRITEFCGWFLGNFDMWHNCGSNRSYTASEK